MTGVADLRGTLGAAPLERDVLIVSGPEAEEFLQGQLSQDIDAIAVDDSAASFLLQPSGKVDAWLRVTRLADSFLLDLEPGCGEAAAARLRRFKLRTKVEIDLETWRGTALRGPGSAAVRTPPGVHRLRALWPEVEGIDLLGAGPAPAVDVPDAARGALESLRVELGVPAMGAELTDSTIPAEVGQWVIDASVSFTKGCYTGQELVARIDSRGGNVPKPIRSLRGEGGSLAVGADVLAADDGAEVVVGTVTSSARSARFGAVALAAVRRSVEPGASVTVRGPAGPQPAVVAEPPLR